ncbi:MAG: CHAD domain-containing protein [Deltaproteobacteria bacterium]|nr:CHAD domain-containing protein [Deltaproteobacteria bacterium]
MAPACDDSYRLLGSEILLMHLDRLQRHADGIRAGDADIEHVHQMRVASRRIRSALRLFEACFGKRARKWRASMRRVTRRLGEARDLDVQITFLDGFLGSLIHPECSPGIRRIRLRLRQQRDRLQRRVVDAVERLWASELVAEMSKALQQVRVQAELRQIRPRSGFAYARAREVLPFLLQDMLIYEAFLDNPEQIRQHHEMRIAAKRLRYSTEVFVSLYDGALEPYLQAIKKVQTELGKLHDCDVWIDFLPRFLAEERQRSSDYFGHTRSFGRLSVGIEYLADERRKQRRQIHDGFCSLWTSWREEGIWPALLATVESPPELEAQPPAGPDGPPPGAAEPSP